MTMTVSQQENILVVDDTPENLQVLSGMLQERGYLVRPVPNGRLALMAAKSEPPDLILLDINMPEINGYEVCERLKQDASLREIPVIFISALTETLDKVKAFQVGGVDYITKPFQFEEVYARVNTHLALRRSQLELQTMLSDTFMASIQAMQDILSMVSPAIFDQSNRLKRYMTAMTTRLKLHPEQVWQLEMAATLSQLGCVTLSQDILDKKIAGVVLSLDEERCFRDHPGIAAELISGIPRLEQVSAIIRRQQTPLEVGEPLQDLDHVDIVRLGSKLLRLLIEYDYHVMRNKSPVKAFAELSSTARMYCPVFLGALRSLVEQEAKQAVRSVKVQDLAPGMILMENITNDSGVLVLNRANELSLNLLKLLRHYAEKNSIREPILVLDKIPMATGSATGGLRRI